jgi:nucleoside-diphosphate-sugar epimerase
VRRVLVVGGAGYVGSVLTEELLQRGYAVRVLDRLYFGDSGLRGVRDRIELVEADMRAVSPRVLEGVDAVVNVGGLSNDPTAEYNPRANHEMNTVATASLARLCKAEGVRRYVLASSCSIYDCGVLDEGADVLQDETAPVAPRAPYSLSKYDAEREILPMAGEGFCPVALRKGTIYGYSPRMRYDLVVNTFVRDALARGRLTLYHGGEMWRPLVTSDAAQAYIALVEADDAAAGQIFNSATRTCASPSSLRAEACRARIEVDLRPDYHHGSVRNYRVSGDKIGRVLSFRPKVSIEESVADMIQRIRADGRTDLQNPRYYNIRWIQHLEDERKAAGTPGSVLDAPPTPLPQ